MESGGTIRERIHSPPQAWEPRSRRAGIPAAAGLHSNTWVVGVEHKPLGEQDNKQALLHRKSKAKSALAKNMPLMVYALYGLPVGINPDRHISAVVG